MSISAPNGYTPVEWDDGTVHAVNIDTWMDAADSGPLWRAPVVCDSSGPGVSSDEGGHDAVRAQKVTCADCIGILS
jgi:hypothetical protein